MKRLIFTFIIFQVALMINAQEINSEYIQKHTRYFTIQQGKIQGKGLKIFKDMTKNSQFINLGETHGSKEISLITQAMIDLLIKNNFHYFALEVGPHSADVLSRLSADASKTVTNLNKFNSTYSVDGGGETAVPIPFFEHVSDAEFLQKARQEKMQLWGLDQEYYYSTFFLMDEMMRTIKGTSKASKIERLKLLAQQSMFKHYMAEAQNKIDDPFPLILQEESVLNFFNAFEKDNTKAQAIIKDLKITWDIYSRWRKGSHQDRISYMRNNFIESYNKAIVKGETPKVFTKIGSAHASKLISNSSYDVGSLTEELAKANGTKSISINTWVPFSKTDKGVVKNVDRYYSYKRFQEFFALAKQDEYAIIDLQKIREDVESGKVKLPTDGAYHAMRMLLYGYDYQIMLPLSEGTVLNRK